MPVVSTHLKAVHSLRSIHSLKGKDMLYINEVTGGITDLDEVTGPEQQAAVNSPVKNGQCLTSKVLYFSVLMIKALMCLVKLVKSIFNAKVTQTKAGREAGKCTLLSMIFLRVAGTMINSANHFLPCFLHGWQVCPKYGLLLPPHFVTPYRLSEMPSMRGVFPIKFKFQTVPSFTWYMPLSVMLTSTVHIHIP